MKIGISFPEGHNSHINRDRLITAKGITDKSLEGEKIRVKGFSEEDILQLKQMLMDEIKRQNEEDANNNSI